MTDKPKPRAVKLARSAYQPNKDAIITLTHGTRIPIFRV